PIACTNPRRGVWGGPPGGGYMASKGSISPALNLAFAPRGTVALQDVIGRDLPEIDVKMGVAPTPAPRVAESIPNEPNAPPPVERPAKKTGCCEAGGSAGGSAVLAAFALVVIRRRRS